MGFLLFTLISPHQASPCWQLRVPSLPSICNEEAKSKEFTARSQSYGQKSILRVLVGRRLEPDFVLSVLSRIKPAQRASLDLRLMTTPQAFSHRPVYFLHRLKLGCFCVSLFIVLLLLKHNLQKNKNPVFFHLSHLWFLAHSRFFNKYCEWISDHMNE